MGRLCNTGVGDTILNGPLRLYFLGEVRKRRKYEFYKYGYYFGVPIGAPFLYIALLRWVILFGKAYGNDELRRLFPSQIQFFDQIVICVARTLGVKVGCGA